MTNTPEFTIPVTSLDAGGHEFHFPLRNGWLKTALDESNIGPGEAISTTANDEPAAGDLRIRASKSGSDVIIHGRLKANLLAECARCTGPAKLTIDQPMTALLVPATSSKGKNPDKNDYEFSAEEADTLTYEGETVVLDDMIRDELLLEVPMIPLCSEDCEGINAGSRQDDATKGDAEQAIDPRLAPLLRLKSRS